MFETNNPYMTVITGTNSITAVGHDGASTAEAVFNGHGNIAYDELRNDAYGNPFKTAVIKGSDACCNDGEAAFMAGVASQCLSDLCKNHFSEDEKIERLFLFIGLPSHHRPGPRFAGDAETGSSPFETILSPYAENRFTEFLTSGNAAIFHALKKAEAILSKDDDAVCIVGAVDSLLSPETLAWLEHDGRLVSETRGCEHGLFPSHAAGFFIVDTPKGAAKRRKKSLARIVSHSVAVEPAPYVSEKPGTAQGLTAAIRKTLEQRGIAPESIDSIFCDLNGEYHSFREWGFAGLRCFPDPGHSPYLVHPADCMGDVGAAWGPVLIGLATEGFRRNGVGEQVMIFCSDDHGDRGAMVLGKTDDNGANEP